MRKVFLLVSCALALPRAVAGQQHTHQGAASDASIFPVSCTALAQPAFSRAVTLLHHMTYPQAREAFEAVKTLDPQCAMAHWGVAMTLFQPLWPTRPNPAALRQGWEAVNRAKQLGAPTLREQGFIAMAEAFFLEPDSADYWLRIRRWKSATERLHATFPSDDESAVFAALAELATAPADTVSREHVDRAATILVGVLQRSPAHPGAMHYLVHANDAPGREGEEAANTRQYEAIAPNNPHALHMPTHIYTRLGDWPGVVRGNLLAADAALLFPAGASGELVWDEFPHAIEYLIYGYLQQGSDDLARAQLQRLLNTAGLEPSFKTAFHLASTQSRFALERQAWAEATQLAARTPDNLPWDRFPWPEAIVRFAQGYGGARLGDVESARLAVGRLGELESVTQRSGEQLFTRNIRVMRLSLSGWIRQLEGASLESRLLLQEAVALEAATPKHAVTPGPIIPTNELLGDLLMLQARPSEALAAYRSAVTKHPNRFNSVLGVARAALASGDRVAAHAAYRELLRIAAVGDGSRASLEEARKYLAHHESSLR